MAKGPCPSPDCTSSDGFETYEDGHGHCYVCDHHVFADSEEKPVVTKKPKKAPPKIPDEYKGTRGIAQRTMEKLKYGTGPYREYDKSKEEWVEYPVARYVAVPYGDGRGHAATKIRLPNKDFRYIGATQDAALIFQNIWQSGGKKVVITEGEYDALSVSHVQDNKYPVVSLPNGTKSAAKACLNARKWLNSFEEIVLWFDADDPGQEAIEEVAHLFPIGKVKVVRNPEGAKDANDLLKANRVADITNCIWRAEPYTPARFVSFGSLKEEVLKPVERGLPWIFDELNEWTYGRRPGENYYFGAGTGVGKTDFFTQQAAADIANGEKVALFSFEQSPVESAKRLAGKFAGKRFHVPDAGWTTGELESAFDTLESTGAFIYDHWGSADWATVEEDITTLALSGYKHFYIDHLTAFAAHADDERKELEAICADIAKLGAKLGVYTYVISHLATPDGTPHEEGGRVFVRHFKGSRAIGYWAHFMFGIERNTQAESPDERIRARLRCLKDRYTGEATGKCLTMLYDGDTGLQSVDNDWEWPDSKKKSAKDYGFQESNDDF